MYDVIIVGGGHNGLTCAAYLSRAGRRVLVLEANAELGGFVLSGDVPGAPGFRMNTFGFEFPFVALKPSIVDELELSRLRVAVDAAGPAQHLPQSPGHAVLALPRPEQDL